VHSHPTFLKLQSYLKINLTRFFDFHIIQFWYYVSPYHTSALLVYLLTVFPLIGHQLYWNIVFYIWRRDQSDCAPSHQDSSRCIYECCTWEHCTLENFLKFLLHGKICCSKPINIPNFMYTFIPIVGLKISSLPNFALKSLNKMFIWLLRKLIEYTVQFLIN